MPNADFFQSYADLNINWSGYQYQLRRISEV